MEATLQFIGSEDLFMRNSHKININDTSIDESINESSSKDEILIKRDGRVTNNYSGSG
jgi:hypothetical protein